MRTTCSSETYLPELLQSLAAKNFAELLRLYISEPGPIRNFGAFYWLSLKNDKSILSMWNGELGDYRLRSASESVINNRKVHKILYESVRNVKLGCRKIVLLRPSIGDPRHNIFKSIGILERLSVASRNGDRGLITFYLRSKRDGPVTEEQFEHYKRILPVAHELIEIRQKLMGCERFQYLPGNNVSTLKERGLPHFSDLTEREAQVCDAVVEGKTAHGTALELGISVSTVNTFKRRAFSKLEICSGAQLSALVINDQSG